MQDALHIAKPAAEGALVAAMEGLIMGDTISKIEIGPLLVEQRRIADEFRVIERSVTDYTACWRPRSLIKPTAPKWKPASSLAPLN